MDQTVDKWMIKNMNGPAVLNDSQDRGHCHARQLFLLSRNVVPKGTTSVLSPAAGGGQLMNTNLQYL